MGALQPCLMPRSPIACACCCFISQVECTMESPPAMSELRDLISQMEFLSVDPLDALKAEQAP